MRARVYVNVGKQLRWLEADEAHIHNKIHSIGEDARTRGVEIMQEEVPVLSGQLQDSVGGELEIRESGGTIRIFADAPHAQYIDGEGRTDPHEILPRFGKALKFELGGVTTFAKRVFHPGSTQTPFTSRTLERLRLYVAMKLSEIFRNV